MTKLLPPLSAVQMTWVTAIKFSAPESIDLYEEYVKPSMTNIIESSKSDEKENEYILKAIPMMAVTLKNINTLRKGRELNYADNKILRNVYLESINQKFDLVSKIKDFVKNLPAITIAGTGGLVFAEGTLTNVDTSDKLFFALLFAAIGYGINQLINRYLLQRKQLNYIKEDYQTTCYYENYLDRVEVTLHNLFDELEALHQKLFGEKYHSDINGKRLITKMIADIRSKRCRFIKSHMEKGLITSDIWHLCEIESGREKECPYYKKEMQHTKNE
ncbi:MAG: hypothetical protein JXB49_07595 [Bacteroidales bacterium]|nr:hypothetical protein [Bacteroidales bacterium]